MNKHHAIAAAVPHGSRQVCTFALDDLLFGVDAQYVHEVIRWQPLTAVPLAPSVVRGLINLRGQIVTAIDMRERLGLPPKPDEQPPMNVVVYGAEGAVSLLVDEIGDVLDLDDADAESPPREPRSSHPRAGRSGLQARPSLAPSLRRGSNRRPRARPGPPAQLVPLTPPHPFENPDP